MVQDKTGKEAMGAVVKAAIEAFEKRFEVRAEVVEVNEKVAEELGAVVGGRQVRKVRYVRRNYSKISNSSNCGRQVRKVRYVRPHCALAGVAHPVEREEVLPTKEIASLTVGYDRRSQ